MHIMLYLNQLDQNLSEYVRTYVYVCMYESMYGIRMKFCFARILLLFKPRN